MDARYIDVLPMTAEAEAKAREKRSAMEGKLAALVLAAFLLGSGTGLATGLKAGEYRTALKYAEQTAAIAQAERDNAEELVRQYKSVIRQMRIDESAATVLEEPEPGTYDDEFGWDFDIVVRVGGAEWRDQPFEGMIAGFQCIKDAAEITGMTPEEVVKDLGYGYAEPVGHEVLAGMDAINEAALQVFGQGVRVTDEPIEFFYSTKNGKYSAWHEESLRFVMQIGDHRFFKRA